MDEHKTQQPEPEIVPARRKSGRMRSWKASILACVICILVTALVTSLIFVGKFGGSRNYKLALKFAQVKQVVDKNYIGDADDTAISDAASSAIISAIGDKWSYYMTAEEYKAYQMYSNNEYAGIGVTIQLDDKTKGFRITAVTSDSPAANAGLKQGDIILSIDGEDVTGKTLSEVQTIIRAKLNKTLKLTVQDTAGKSRTVTLDCTVIYTDPVTYKLMDNGVGYVRIRNFETGGGTGVPIIASTNLDGNLTSLPSPVMDGYTFEGWYTDELEGDRITTNTEFTSDGTIYAHWRPIAKGGPPAASKPSPNTPPADEGFSFRSHAGTFLVAWTMFFTLVALYAR